MANINRSQSSHSKSMLASRCNQNSWTVQVSDFLIAQGFALTLYSPIIATPCTGHVRAARFMLRGHVWCWECISYILASLNSFWLKVVGYFRPPFKGLRKNPLQLQDFCLPWGPQLEIQNGIYVSKYHGQGKSPKNAAIFDAFEGPQIGLEEWHQALGKDQVTLRYLVPVCVLYWLLCRDDWVLGCFVVTLLFLSAWLNLDYFGQILSPK